MLGVGIISFAPRGNWSAKRGNMGLRVTINGEEREFDASVSVDALLAQLGLEPAKIAVERNLEIVPRSQYRDVTVTEGDRLEIVQFIGGGM